MRHLHPLEREGFESGCWSAACWLGKGQGRDCGQVFPEQKLVGCSWCLSCRQSASGAPPEPTSQFFFLSFFVLSRRSTIKGNNQYAAQSLRLGTRCAKRKSLFGGFWGNLLNCAFLLRRKKYSFTKMLWNFVHLKCFKTFYSRNDLKIEVSILWNINKLHVEGDKWLQSSSVNVISISKWSVLFYLHTLT